MWGSNPQPPANIYVCVFAVTGELNPVIFPVRKLPAATAAAAALGAIQYVKIIVFHVLDRTAVSVSPQRCEAVEQKADMQSDIYAPCECIKTLTASIHAQGAKILKVLHNALRYVATYCDVDEGVFRLDWRLSSSSV